MPQHPPGGHCGTMPAEPGTLPAAVRIARLAVAGRRYGHARALLAAHLPAADLHSVELCDLIDAADTYAAARTGDQPDSDTAATLPLHVAAAVAGRLIGNGSHANTAAAALLESYLTGLDPDHTPAVPALIDAAAHYGAVAWHRPRGHAWATYAYRASRAVCDPYDDRSTYALHILATSLTLHGRHDEAIELCHDHLVVAEPWAPPGPLSHIRMCLAEALHAGGRCGQAIREATTALHDWPDACEGPDPGYAVMAVRAAAMLAGCGRHSEAIVCLINAISAFPPPGSAARRDRVARAIRAIRYAELTHRAGCARTHDAEHGLAPPLDGEPVTISDFFRELLT
jgi:hypothetical protein